MPEQRFDYPIGAIEPGTATQLGATVENGGVNFAVFSEHADLIEICLFSETDGQELCRLPLPSRSGSVFHGFVPGLKSGARYGLRAHGPYAPEEGQRFNPHKLLLDPYAKEYFGKFHDTNILLGYDFDDENKDLSFDTRDSAAYVPKCVVQSTPANREDAFPRRRNYAEEVIYEAHVKGLTRLHPGVDESIRGTYDALSADAVIDHLHSLGITTVELLPVHAFIDDTFLLERGLSNYWGYNTIGFFCPESRYCGPEGPAGLRNAIAKLKDAGISVILDVVYNHTAEGDQNGPTLSFRGLDNRSYYRLQNESPRFYINDTGCGNTLNCSHRFVNRMILDSLRYWVTHYGVDGFRFDLATTLARTPTGYDSHGIFLSSVTQDPLLSQVRLIAEPWDIGPGGYQLGQFPAEFSEWNDQYRDSVRKFWRGDEHSAQALAGRLLGSADIFDHHGRRSWSSINFLTAHDGFTLTDLTRYNERHNEANTEENRDGHGANYSDNFGVEGETDNIKIERLRVRRVKNMLTTLFVSQGVPMLLAGDEIGNTQQGNNNAYCQDNEIGWINWDNADANLLDFAKALINVRKLNRALRQSTFLHGTEREADELPDAMWLDFSAEPLQWDAPDLGRLALLLRTKKTRETERDTAVLIAFNRTDEAHSFPLKKVDCSGNWRVAIDTSQELQTVREITGAAYEIDSNSVVICTF